MPYLFLVLFVLIGIAVGLHESNRRRRTRKLEKLREAWAQPKKGPFYFSRIRSYADTVPQADAHRLNDQTIEDIDFHSLFTFIDRTTSRVGQQFFFRKLVQPKDAPDERTEELIKVFSSDAELREKTQVELLRLTNSDAYEITSLLNAKLLERPWWFGLLAVDIAAILVLLILSFKFPVALVFLLVPFTVNMFLHYWNVATNSFRFVTSIPQLNLLIEVSKQLSKSAGSLWSKSVDDSITKLRPFQHKVSLLNFHNNKGVEGELNQLATYFVELIKMVFLVELFILFNAVRELEGKQAAIVDLFDYVGGIDAAIGIIALRAGSLKTCRPVFTTAGKNFSAKGVYHPLIKDCVKNDLTVNGKSILITGSNMSGKSTFLRTLIINSVLAQTINTCFADEFTSPPLKQYSSVRIDDTLFEGKSYFMQEVTVMGSLIEQAESSYQNLFILDEVFKGTNTTERIAAAKSILSYLNRGYNIVIVSTHDLELSDLLSREYDLYHFTELIENNSLHFDHKIRQGALKTGNAIRILELSGYPAEVVREARQICIDLKS